MEKLNVRSQIRNNSIKTYAFFLLFIVLAVGMGYFLGYLWGSPAVGIIVAGMLGIFWVLINYFSGDKIILSVSGAKEVKKQEYPYLYNTVEGLSLAAGLPMPKIYVIDDPSPNAFATGRNPQHSAVAVTTGLLKMMNRQELEGVLAHEMSHIKNYDIRIATVGALLFGVVVIISQMFLRSLWFSGGRDRDNKSGAIILIGILFAVLAPLFAQMTRLAISRKREYMADASGAMLTRYPPGLASALEKISKANIPVKRATDTTAHLYISNPLKGRKKSFSGLFSTHPPSEKRIDALKKMTVY